MDTTMRPICDCGRPHPDPRQYAKCMKKRTLRSGARFRTTPALDQDINAETHAGLLTEAADPAVIGQLKAIKNPKKLAEAVLDECRSAQKLFYRTVMDWDSALDPTQLRQLSDFADPVVAFNACIEVSESLMRRYPGLLSMTGTELVNDHPAKNPLQLHHHSANIVIADLRRSNEDATVIDFTMSQLHPELAFPWVGPRRVWVALVNRTPSPTAALTRELALI